MTILRALLIDDDADIREIVAFSLRLDSELVVRGCASGEEGFASAIDDAPDVILLDVMMPHMDGPMTLAKLRSDPRTKDIPVIFMTARAQSQELERFNALGAAGVIAKPFDPMTLVAEVRQLLRPVADTLQASRAIFFARLAEDADTLIQCREALADETYPRSVLVRVRDVAHGLSGAAGIFGVPRIGEAATDLTDLTEAALRGARDHRTVKRGLDRLMTCIGQSLDKPGGEADVSVLDRKHFDELLVSFSPHRILALLASFETQLDGSLRAAADKPEERTSLVREAHRLIGTSGALGFLALSQVARELEDACYELEERFGVLTAVLARAVEVKAATKGELDNMIAQLGRAA